MQMQLAKDVASRPLKVLVAMSGGVDSSYVAALMKQQGHDVTGVTLKVWQDKIGGPLTSKPKAEDACEVDAGGKKTCCGTEDLKDAGAVGRTMGFPHYVLDYEERFKTEVIDSFVQAYLDGRTPNPCVACNDKVKFDPLLKTALGLGCDKLATGHYARLSTDPDGRVRLLKARDPRKDQTYFLYRLTQPQLRSLLFPLGEMEKADVRQASLEMGLPTATKRESMDICFVPKGDYGEVLRKLAPQAVQPGLIVDEQGRELGQHQGLAFFTIGQRRGIGIASSEALYVLRLDRENNQVVLGPESGLFSRRARMVGMSLTRDGGPLAQPVEDADLRCMVKIRSSHVGAWAKISRDTEGRWTALFDEPQKAVCPGQAAVFYDGDECLGGAVIDASDREIDER
jgi:tRNA-specific 2-thiouridylase